MDLSALQSAACCAVCRNFETEGTTNRIFVQILIYSDVRRKAQLEECLLCKLFYQTFLNCGVSSPVADGVYVQAQFGSPFYATWSEEDGRTLHIEIYQRKGSKSGIKGLGWASDIVAEPNDADVQAKVSQWIRMCDETHPRCRFESQRHPKRLLDLEILGGDEIRLVEDVQPWKYVALSHCVRTPLEYQPARWGDSRWCTTTTSNLRDRLVGIPWNELAKTFQDAVTITRQIGVRYLWIDSLCILQDEELDWKTESTRMGDIYRGAYLTIAASTAPNDDEGFLEPTRERQIYASRSLEFTFRDRVIKDIRIRNTHDLRQHPFYSIKEPLSTRGWTMQERYLSTRVLSFSSAVFFECISSTCCECGHGVYPDPLYPPVEMLGGLDYKSRLWALLSDKSADIERMYSEWANMVTVYSGRQLTYESDRQVAILAIVKALAARFGDEYIAGLWKGGLVPGLAWYCDDATPRVKSPSSSNSVLARQPPSWSWFSSDTLVFTSKLKPNPPCTVVTTAVQGGGIDDTGPAHGSITLKASTGSILLHMNNDCQFLSKKAPRIELLDPAGKLIQNTTVWTVRLDNFVGPGFAIDSSGRRYESVRKAAIAPQPPGDRFSTTVLGLHLGSSVERPSADWRCELPEIFLLLAGVEEPLGTYTRIGYLVVSLPAESLQTWSGGVEKNEIIVY